jgi:hypothetical protein
MGTAILSLVALLLLCPPIAEAKGGRGGPAGGTQAHSHSYHAPKSNGGAHRRNYSQTAPRDSKGRIQRSVLAKNAFKRSHPCPSTHKSSGACPGYVIDHIKALKHGGVDAPSNMQWQTKEAAKQKDKWE